MESDADRGRRCAGPTRLDVARIRAVYTAGRNCGLACRGTELGGDRLGADRRAVRRPGPGRAVIGHRAEPRCRDRDARRPGTRPRADRCDPRTWCVTGLSPHPRGPGRSAPATRPPGRRTIRLRARFGARRRGTGAATARTEAAGIASEAVIYV